MKRNLLDKSMWKNIDWLLLSLVFVIVLFGMVAVTSTVSISDTQSGTAAFIESLDFSYALLELAFFVVGLVGIFVILLLDYNNLRDFSNILYWIAVVLLILVWQFGATINGTTGWFKIGNRSFQPAELCKIVIIIVLAKEFAARTEASGEGLKTFREIFPMVWRFIIPFVLILVQPDWGTAIVYFCIFFGMLFMAKTSIKIIGVMIAIVAALVPLAWLFFMDDWQKARLYSFVDPELDPEGTGMQILRSKSVASSGGLNGKGFFSEDLLTRRANYLPENETDFIFSSTIEAVGFVGGIVLLILYFLLIMRLIQLSMRAKDDFGAYIILGVSFMLLFHIFENIGMNIGIMPITGIPLPLFSYGGSNLLTTMLAIGLVLNVNMRRSRRSI